MSNLPNRSNYGFLSCIHSLLKSRFDPKIINFNLDYLKYDYKKKFNTIDYCSGGRNISNPLQVKLLNRKKYCPFVNDIGASHVCNLTYAVNSDSQKSKAVGTAALILEILDLLEINYTYSGRIKNLNWTSEAEQISKLNWGDEKLGKYLIEKILSYGPVIGFLYNAKLIANKESIFNRQELRDLLGFPSIEEQISGKSLCSKQKCPNNNKTFLFQTGTTTSDSKSRTMKTIFFLSAATGIILPKDVKIEENSVYKYPFLIDDWYFNKWSNTNTYPALWRINQKRYQKIIGDQNFIINKSISYKNFLQQSAHRNLTNSCALCSKNLINLFYQSVGDTLKKRRFLLLKCLQHSKKINKFFKLASLSKSSINNKNFTISKKKHYESLKQDLKFANLCGLIFINDDYNLKNISNIDMSIFGNLDDRLNNEIQLIIDKCFKD